MKIQNNHSINILLLSLFLLPLASCSESSTEPTEIVPQEVVIGSYTWMTSNLNVTRFSNGDTIPEAKTELEWYLAGKYQKPAWCYYNNDPKNGEKYGKMYNWYAINDYRGLAPRGYRLADYDAWYELIELSGGFSRAGYYLKSKYGWPNRENGVNEVQFTAFPGGCRFHQGEFSSIGKVSYWWVDGFDECIYVRLMGFNTEVELSQRNLKNYGYYVRCIKY